MFIFVAKCGANQNTLVLLYRSEEENVIISDFIWDFIFFPRKKQKSHVATYTVSIIERKITQKIN